MGIVSQFCSYRQDIKANGNFLPDKQRNFIHTKRGDQ